MKMFVCCMFDKGTGQYGNPFVVVSKGQAIRSFSDEINKNSEGNTLNMHPDDFELYYLGVYDSETGMFATDTPERISRGSDVKVRQ